MKQISGKRFCKLLESKGWILKRIQGSHHIFMKEGNLPAAKNWTEAVYHDSKRKSDLMKEIQMFLVQ